MKQKPSISHEKAIIQELRDDPQFAAEYLKAAMEEADEPGALLVALRQRRLHASLPVYRFDLDDCRILADASR